MALTTLPWPQVLLEVPVPFCLALSTLAEVARSDLEYLGHAWLPMAMSHRTS